MTLYICEWSSPVVFLFFVIITFAPENELYDFCSFLKLILWNNLCHKLSFKSLVELACKIVAVALGTLLESLSHPRWHLQMVPEQTNSFLHLSASGHFITKEIGLTWRRGREVPVSWLINTPGSLPLVGWFLREFHQDQTPFASRNNLLFNWLFIGYFSMLHFPSLSLYFLVSFFK